MTTETSARRHCTQPFGSGNPSIIANGNASAAANTVRARPAAKGEMSATMNCVAAGDAAHSTIAAMPTQ